MNEQELDQALRAIGTRHVRQTAPAALREMAVAVPSSTPERRRWLLAPPTWRYQPESADGSRGLVLGVMSSATKVVVAGAVVALVGGFLLSGVLTQRSDQSLPLAGASASAPVEPNRSAPASLESSAEPVASEETTSLVWERVEIPAEMDWWEHSLEYSTGTYLVASSSDRTLVSQDGLAWSEVPVLGEIVASYAGTLVVADGDRFSTVQLAGDASAPEGLLTIDGLRLPPSASRLNSRIAYGPAGLVFASCKKGCPTRRDVWHTADGHTWKRAVKLPRGGYEDIIATADGFVARTDLGGRFGILYSADGRTWKRTDKPTNHRYALVGSAPFGTLLRQPDFDGSPTGALATITRHGLEPLSVPADVKARMTRSEPDGWGAGGLGVVGIFDGLMALSIDGTTWRLGTLPDSVPQLRFGDNGEGRPLLHVTEDVVLLETTTCVEPDREARPQIPYSTPSLGPEVDCPGLYGSGQKTVWFRGMPR